MKHHKGKALEEKCLCAQCPHKFECFTQERIFSDPIFQGLFEALMAKGRTREQALEEVTSEIKLRMNRIAIEIGGSDKDGNGNVPFPLDIKPWVPYQPYDTGSPIPQPYTTWVYGDNITITDGTDSEMVNVTYHMASGEEIKWSANASEFNRFGQL